MKKSYKDLSYKELVAERVLSHLDNPVALRTTRRDIARLNTRIHAVDIGIAKAK